MVVSRLGTPDGEGGRQRRLSTIVPPHEVAWQHALRSLRDDPARTDAAIMDTPRMPEGSGDRTASVMNGTAYEGDVTQEPQPRPRYTPWTGDVQLPLPVHREDGQRQRSTTSESPLDADWRVPDRNIRRHVTRAVLRVGALLSVDLTAFGVVLVFLNVVGLDWVGATATSGVGYLLQPHGVRAFVLALLVGLAVTGNYGAGDRRRDGARLMLGCVLAACIFAWRPLWETPVVAALELGVLVLTLGSLIVVFRYVLDRLVQQHRSRTSTAARTILVGSAADCTRVYVQRLARGETGFDVIGYVETAPTASRGDALGGIAELERILQEYAADTVLLCGDLAPACVNRVIRAATVNECELLAVSPAFDTAGVRPAVVWRRGQPFLTLREEAVRGRELLLKRAFDATVAAVLLVILAPLFAVIAIVVRLESPGSPIFGHLRAGRHGRYFRCLKFRTMYADAEERLRSDPELYRRYVENDFKLPAGEDPRITRVGRFLRRTSLDELPQLVNVLRGEMSLVGPRPIIREELTQYADDQPLLLSLRPGLTGLWQVNGRSSVPYPARKFIELEYVQSWSLMRDIEILLRTIPAVLQQRGAG